MTLTRRRCLITGSCRNIGLAIARRLAEGGAEVLIHTADHVAGADAAAEVRAGGGAECIVADFREPGAGTRVADQSIAGDRAVDILVLNAALQIRNCWSSITSAEVAEQVAVNLQANLELLQGLVPPMQQRGWGRVIVIGSVQEAKPHPDMLIYAGLKAALSNIARNLARQVAGDGVTVNVVAPGVIETDRNRDALSNVAYRRRILDQIPSGRFGDIADCAGAVAFFASDETHYITGATIEVDGGMHLG